MPELSQYTWLVVVGSLGAFAFGWGTGANDVANAFGTSVGAKTLTLKQAVIIAAIFEFLGALVLGRVSTSTIAGGIADVSTFASSPESYAYGMVCALTACSVWQVLCSYWGYNVSSTHSIISSIVGFSFVWAGSKGVNWYQWDSTVVPPFKGVVPIFFSWVFSPLFAAIMSAFIMFLCRTLILRRKNATYIAVYAIPIIITITSFINLIFIFMKGAKKMLVSEDDWSDDKSVWVAAACSVGLGAVIGGITCPILLKRLKTYSNSPSEVAITHIVEANKPNPTNIESEITTQDVETFFAKAKRMVLHGVSVDIHDVVETDPVVKSIHENAEVFDPKVEMVFSWLQVYSAICVIFAHGANDVGYMAGPLATIFDIYETGKMNKSVTPPIWVLVICASSLVIGLATYGYNVTRTMGTVMAKLSPSRGFSAELSTALVILITSQYGLPTSSSQVITGAVVGVGLLEGITSGVNWRFFGMQFISWVGTLVFCSISTAALYAQGIYAPSKV